MSSELRNDDKQQSITITPAIIAKGESSVADMPFSPAPPFEDQHQPLPQQPTINATIMINSGESHVATTLTVVPSSSTPSLSSISVDTMSSELMNDDQQQPITITPASIDKGESSVADMPFSPTPPFEDQQQPLPQQPTISATTMINSGESHVATTMTVVPSSSAPPLSSISVDASKKRRGRPLGSRNKIQSKKRASGSVIPVTAHIMMVNVQENVLEKIMTFSHNLYGNISILSAVGTTSKVTVCVNSKIETYEGRFEIISLGGSLIHKEESHCKIFGGLNVSLSSNGRVFGGQLVDILMAASPVQIVLGSYSRGNQEEVKSVSKEASKEDPMSPSAESQGKVESHLY